MTSYALDSNIISFYLKDNEKVIRNIETAIENNAAIVITPVSYYEVKRGLLLINARRQLEKFNAFCELFPAGQLDNNILETAIQIYVNERKAQRNTEDADILIAAFCMQNGYTLVTDNMRHFECIKGLDAVNWAK